MSCPSIWLGIFCLGAFACAASSSTRPLCRDEYGVSTQRQETPDTKQGSADDSAAAARLTRGKKLMLKDGNFQLVREYERKGERVRYFSLERGAWEEIPAAMVDWDATAKAQADSDKASAALLGKIHAQEEATKIETVLDVDASLQVAPGIFLPPGEGMFAIEGKSVTPIRHRIQTAIQACIKAAGLGNRGRRWNWCALRSRETRGSWNQSAVCLARKLGRNENPSRSRDGKWLRRCSGLRSGNLCLLENTRWRRFCRTE